VSLRSAHKENKSKMTRQENRGLADMRAANRKKRLQKILAAKKAKQKPPASKLESGRAALVVGVGPGLAMIAIDGETRQVRCDLPVAPGDGVEIRHEKVTAIAPRRTTLARMDPANPYRERVIAANLDTLVIVAAIADPPLRPGLIDRYLVAAARGGVQPILCVNKLDLSGDTSVLALWREMGVPVVLCSTVSGAGVDELRDLLAGSLSVLAGHSGVGKSSLLNALADQRHARTGAVSDLTGKGRQTTTSSRLYELRNGARIIDTPGIREFDLGRVTLPELQAAFAEFEAYTCRFRDCTHRTEPECGVRAAFETGAIAKARYGSYLRLAEEI
jgi:ribosome biogenesis GTPase / thiamine phosphate phosphatase